MLAFFSVQASASGAPIRLTNPSLSIPQPQFGAVGSLLAAPGASSFNSTLSLKPFLTPAITTLQPVPQLKPAAILISPAVQSQDNVPVMPSLQSLAQKAQTKDKGPDAAVINNFYDRSAQAAPADIDRSAPLTKDPSTGLYGVSREQLSAIVSILRRHYGENLLDLAAIGSRAKGKASALKGFRPPTGYSDLDLAPLLRDMGGRSPDSFAIEREIEAASGIPIQLHGVISAGEDKFKEAVPFYGGGYETYEWFSAGEAVRINLSI